MNVVVALCSDCPQVKIVAHTLQDFLAFLVIMMKHLHGER
jgi:hypothetical protein